MVVPPTPMGTGLVSSDEFDDWLVQGAPPTPNPKPAATASASSSSWFSGASFLSSAADAASAALSSKGITVPAAISLSVPTASSFGAGFASGSTLLNGVTTKLKATIEDNVSQFQREADRYCTDEVQRKEIAELSQLVAKVGQTVTLAPTPADGEPNRASDATTANSSSSAAASTVAATADWLDAPAHLRAALERAVLALSEQPDGLREPPELVEESADELNVLMGCAKAALVFDERLNTRRFELVPRKMSDQTFWKHYFMRVLRERRVLKLTPLALPVAASAAASAAATSDGAASSQCCAGSRGSASQVVLASASTAYTSPAVAEADALLDLTEPLQPALGAAVPTPSLRASGSLQSPLDLDDLEAEADRLLELSAAARTAPPAPAAAAAAVPAVMAPAPASMPAPVAPEPASPFLASTPPPSASASRVTDSPCVTLESRPRPPTPPTAAVGPPPPAASVAAAP